MEERIRPHPSNQRLEILITVVLGLAAVATAFAAYKHEIREHHATEAFTDAIRANTLSAGLYSSYNAAFS